MKQAAAVLFFVLAPLAIFAAPSAPAALPQNARLAVVGDSITEQKLYSKNI